jgi:hypothetical protein
VTSDDRPIYILASRAQALDRVQKLIQPDEGEWKDPPLPSAEQWAAIVEAAFPPPTMATAPRPTHGPDGDHCAVCGVELDALNRCQNVIRGEGVAFAIEYVCLAHKAR